MIRRPKRRVDHIQMSQALLRVENLQTWFGRGDRTVRAVDDVSFEIRKGETFALLGESGCGKSMTSLSIMRLVPQPAGRIVGGVVRINGEDLLMLPETAMRNVRGGRIAMIFQEPMTSLNPVMTIGAQIEESVVRHKNLQGGAARRRGIELLATVGIPDPQRRYDDYPHQLSGGMKQRVMIAIALAGDPELLIADEPTTALDVTIQAQVLDVLRKLQNERGMSILLITHDLGVVSEMADRVAVMYAGQIVEVADRRNFFADPRHPYTKKLFESLPTMTKRGQRLAVIRGAVPSLAQEFHGCRFAERCDYAWDACRRQVPRWVAREDEHGVRCHRYDDSVARGEPRVTSVAESPVVMPAQAGIQSPAQPLDSRVRGNDGEAGALLAVDELQVFFPIRKGLFQRLAAHVKAVDGVSLRIARGRTLALVGESGCGKTTVAKGVLQLVRPTGGRVTFDNVNLLQQDKDQMRRRRRDIQIIFQDPFSSMNPRMMVRNIIEEGMLAQGIGRNAQEREERIDRLLAQVGLSPEIKHRYPHEFSGGQRQRICIARALAVEPKLIICDEPTSALDVSVQAQILNLLKSLQEQMGLAFLFITHNISVVEYLAHEVAVMYLGRIVEHGTVEEVLRAPRHPYTRALLSAVPKVDAQTQRQVIRLEGELPSPVHPPRGCHFHPRCPQVMERCRGDYPDETNITATHRVKCFLAGG
jgi:peptide/nickel transport system ATP-binding protein